MKISNSIYFTSQQLKKNNKQAKTQNEFKNINLNSNPIANLNRSSISFGAMKKSQFEGIDLMMVNQLKAPIQNFNSNEDFQNYCQKILDEKYLGPKVFHAEQFFQFIADKAAVFLLFRGNRLVKQFQPLVVHVTDSFIQFFGFHTVMPSFSRCFLSFLRSFARIFET